MLRDLAYPKETGLSAALEPCFLDPTDKLWVDYISTHPNACIFHHPAWINSLAQCYRYRPFISALLYPDGRVAAGVPVMEISQPPSHRRWVSLPFSDHCVPLLDNEQYLDPLVGCLSPPGREGALSLEMRWDCLTSPAFHSEAHHVLHTLPLDPDFKRTAARIHSMHRRNASAARKKGVLVKLGRDRQFLQAFYELHIQTRRRQGAPVQPWRFFKQIGSSLIEKGLGFIMLAEKDGECLAGAVFLHWQQNLMYKYGASSRKSLSLRPNDLIFSTAIQWGCEHGFTCLDLGKTELENQGLREFKSRWGAEELPLAYSYYPAAPGGHGRLVTVLREIIRRSPPFVCRLAGELFYQYLG